MPFDLKFHIHRLLRSEPFFATFSRRVEKRVDNTSPTAAVAFDRKSKRYTLYYNEEFFESLSDEHKVGVIKHEFYHLILKHLTDRRPFDPREEPDLIRVWNIAADLAINSHIYEELPSMACVPGRGHFRQNKSGLTAEAYFEMLKEDKARQNGPYRKNSQGEAPNLKTLDDHSGWNGAKLDEKDASLDESLADNELSSMTKAAIEAADKELSGWGNMPRQVIRQIRKTAIRTVNPETVLRYFVRTSKRSNRVSTVRRINRRYPFILPGSKVNRTANIAISIDQSGSVSDEMGKIFFSFLDKLATIATFTVIPFDTSVAEDEIYTWKKGEKRKWFRVRNGGTDFDAPTEWVNKRKFDGHIILTDMQAGKPVRSKCQRLWITDSLNKNRIPFDIDETVIAIDC